ncbi:MAG: hypothetical protein IJM35_06280 [Bacteroidales bacterium]|nr:hypothetical protein [Bacteroidales bacterium]
MDKLQELTDKLYNEGLSKGKQEGEAILAEARKKAAEIIADARSQAAEITSKASREADDYTSRVKSDLKMAARQSLQAMKTDIENLIITKITAGETSKALSNPEFVKETITAVARNFSATEPGDLSLILPESLRDSLEDFVNVSLGNILGRGVQATFSKKIAGGFTIGPKDGSYFISMTDTAFDALIAEYLRPTARKLLFGDTLS